MTTNTPARQNMIREPDSSGVALYRCERHTEVAYRSRTQSPTCPVCEELSISNNLRKQIQTLDAEVSRYKQELTRERQVSGFGDTIASACDLLEEEDRDFILHFVYSHILGMKPDIRAIKTIPMGDKFNPDTKKKRGSTGPGDLKGWRVTVEGASFARKPTSIGGKVLASIYFDAKKRIGKRKTIFLLFRFIEEAIDIDEKQEMHDWVKQYRLEYQDGE